MSSFARSLPEKFVTPTFKNILFATDFSPCSETAFPYLRDIAEHYGSKVHVIHVIPPEPSFDVPMDVQQEMVADENAARNSLEEMLASKPFGDASYTWTAERGPFWPVLESHIKKENIDLVVLGTHGRRGWKKLLLGSMSEQVFRRAECPVLTVGPHARKTEGPLQHANILFATDFSPASEQAMGYAVGMARTYKAHLVVLHAAQSRADVVETGSPVGAATVEVAANLIGFEIKEARLKMQKLVSPQVVQELNPEVIVEWGLAAETILRVAEDKHADLIVMGAHRSQRVELVTHLPWAVASMVVAKACCPVLTVRS